MLIQRAQRGLGAVLLCAGSMLAAPLNAWSQTPDATNQSRFEPDSSKDSLRKQIADLIEQLGDENYQTRRAAELRLTRIGLPAFEQLRQAMNHPNVQIEVAAKYLVRSQSVTWWLDTDPISVRQVLQDYNERQDRETAMQQLASEKSDVAMLALCRIARYESSERLSKCAALYLMETLVERYSAKDSKQLTPHIREAMGDSQRPAAEWIETLIDGIDAGSPNAQRWPEVARLEYMLLEKTPRDTSKELVNRLHRVIAAHFIEHSERQLALDILRPCLDLVENKSMQVRNAAMWAIDNSLPELVNDLSERHRELFNAEPLLGFLLAESFKATGDQERARVTAEAASERIMKPKSDPGFASGDEIVASQRQQLAVSLQLRGMYDWARIEYEKTLTLELPPRSEYQLRTDFAAFLGEGEEYAAAAVVLGEYVAKVQENPVEEERLKKQNVDHDAESDMAFLLGSFNYYSGMAAIQDRQVDSARSYLSEALKYYPENPDILIAMKRTCTPGVNDESYQSLLGERIAAFHEEVAVLERELISADRIKRRGLEVALAVQCNQLAWLLSKTNERPAEAIQLSLRSLELHPNYGIYQDTLARCYFAAGNIDQAIVTQELAIKNEPFQRSMVRQLEEFKAAKR